MNKTVIWPIQEKPNLEKFLVLTKDCRVTHMAYIISLSMYTNKDVPITQPNSRRFGRAITSEPTFGMRRFQKKSKRNTLRCKFSYSDILFPIFFEAINCILEAQL
jgi:hypothetical protein